MNILALRILLVGMLGLDAEGMGAEIVTLGLQKVGRKVLATITIVEAKRRAEGGKGNAPECSLADDMSPARLSLVDCLVEKVIEQQAVEIRILTICVGDVLEENGADNTAATPHQSNRRLVELPAIF